jgi:hypothetical protein
VVLTADAFTLSVDSGTGTKIVVSPNPAAPTVLSATSPQIGAYGVDRTVTFTLNMNLPVNVSGAPTLTLNDGGTASYVSGSGTSKLTFSSTIGAGKNAAQLTTSLSTLSGRTLDGITGTPVSASMTAIKLVTLGDNTTMVPGSTVKLSANTEAALQAAINIAAPGETIDPAGIHHQRAAHHSNRNERHYRRLRRRHRNVRRHAAQHDAADHHRGRRHRRVFLRRYQLQGHGTEPRGQR